MNKITVSEINVYPIKSCAPLESTSANVGELGLEHDRMFMLLDAHGGKITQRERPILSMVKTALRDSASTTLDVTAPGLETIGLSLESDNNQIEVDVDFFKKRGSGLVIAEGSDYFSEYLEAPVHLVRVKDPRTIKEECQVDGASRETGFADGFPILLSSKESLRRLNDDCSDEDQIPMDRFRANIVVDGADAYDEDYWREIRIGVLQAFVVRACARCPIPNVDQSSGKISRSPAVSGTLQKTRRGVDPTSDSNGAFFGQNITHVYEPGQAVSVGDEVEIVSRSSKRNIILR